MEDIVIPLTVIPILFIGLPWLIFHYITKWKTAATLTSGDEKLLDELHEAARRLDDRLCTIERIMTAENPDWRQQCLPGREDRQRLLADGEGRWLTTATLPPRSAQPGGSSAQTTPNTRAGRAIIPRSPRAARDSIATSA